MGDRIILLKEFLVNAEGNLEDQQDTKVSIENHLKSGRWDRETFLVSLIECEEEIDNNIANILRLKSAIMSAKDTDD